MTNRRKYNEVCLGDKCKALKLLSEGKSVREIARIFSVSIGTVSNWIKNKDKIKSKEKYNEPLNSIRQTRLSGSSSVLDDRIFTWFISARARNIPISGPLVQDKARYVSRLLNMHDFKASNGWLDTFRRRHNICFRNLSGESAGMDHAVVENWKNNLVNIVHGYDQADIWNLDETGLFWRGLPNKSLITKGDQAKGGKLAKDRLTVCLLVSATGEKFNPLIIGKAAMPRAFNKKLPGGVHWRANKKSWMTTSIFMEYLSKFNSQMKQQQRNVILLLDNAPCHTEVKLSNTKLVFMPPNTTAACQPLDAGIIKNFKIHYRKYLLNNIISRNDFTNMDEVMKHINIKHAVTWISMSLSDIRLETIINCFGHCGIPVQLQNADPLINDEQELRELTVFIGNLDCSIIEEDIPVFDANVTNWEENVLNPIENKEPSDENNNDNTDDDDDDLQMPDIPTIQETLKALDVLSIYVNYNDIHDVKKHVNELEKYLIKERMKTLKNTTLDDYWKNKTVHK